MYIYISRDRERIIKYICVDIVVSYARKRNGVMNDA